MLSKRVVLVAVALCCVFTLVPAALYSQNVSSGTITGTVTDPSKAAVADATVTLTDTATNLPRTTTTNEAGRYVFANVTPGTYTVTINKAGFRVAKFTNQVVNVGSSLTLNVALEVGGQHHYRNSVGISAKPWPRRQHFRNPPAWSRNGRQRRRREPGSEFLHAGRRQ